MSTLAIGIDLGTTHSCVAVCQFGKIEIIANDHGNRTTPSYVAFLEEDELVGDAAKSQASQNPENTIYDAKRLIGRRYNDKTIQSDIKYWPFTVSSNGEFPMVQVTLKGRKKTYSPEQISAKILRKMKETAEAFLEDTVSEAVITVPAYFSDYQRQATMEAGKLAGLDVMCIINEPIAAAIAYSVIREDTVGTLLIFDFGGGTLDVSVVTVDQENFIVKSSTGNTHLGGEDIDNNMVDYFVQLFQAKHKKNLKTNKKAISRLKMECESAKKKLSFTTNVTLSIDAIMDGIDLMERLTRAKLDELNADLFSSVISPVKEALESANMSIRDIDKVIAVGGSSRIPKIQSLLKNFFGGKEITTSINPDEAIAYGAAVNAAMRDGVNFKDRTNFIIQDVTPMSLGIAVGYDSVMSVIIPKNSIVPTFKTQHYVTVESNQISASIPVYEGENAVATENIYLGKCVVSNIPPAPAGQEKVDVTFTIDSNRVLRVTAVNCSTGSRAEVVIDRSRNIL